MWEIPQKWSAKCSCEENLIVLHVVVVELPIHSWHLHIPFLAATTPPHSSFLPETGISLHRDFWAGLLRVSLLLNSWLAPSEFCSTLFFFFFVGVLP